ncbi:hypothetical protein [Dyella ginsengisoli]|uniref:hypothetical protein n=1 Tax=Dyella ginsengisoli TaxID=363848 RepID=UPI0018E236F9|nr:hypothetical protein [Dyella ginsengisoli]
MPLSIAAKVLQKATISQLAKDPFTPQGWKIVDRWAFNSPEKLVELEQQGEIKLMNRVLEQQRLEVQVLSESLEQRNNGVAEHEILAANEVQTEL